MGQKVEDLTSDTETKKIKDANGIYGTANSFYRVDDDITSSTTYEFCKYTITTKTGRA